MKIKTIFIKSFKNLTDFSLELGSDWNVIKEDNGFGKTTITQFVTAMLFGLNYRQRDFFEPWNSNSKYGGHLIFEHDRQVFKLERYFGSNARQEEVSFFNQTLGEKLDATDVGQRFLGLSEEAFLQSAFVPQEKIAISNNADFNQKLSGMADANDDGATLEQAIKKLQNYGKKFMFDYGKRGLLPEGKNKAFALEKEIFECKKNMEKAETLLNDVAVLEVESLDIEKQVEQLEREHQRLLLDLSKASKAQTQTETTPKAKTQLSKSMICLFALLACALAAVACFFFEQTVLSIVCAACSLVLLAGFFWLRKIEAVTKAKTYEQQTLQNQVGDGLEIHLAELLKQLQQLRDKSKQIDFYRAQKLKEAELLFNSNQIAELESQLLNCNAVLLENTKKFEVAEITVKLLKEAKQNLSESYLPKLQQLTTELLQNFSGGRFTDVLIDKEFNINITENGMTKQLRYFSRGIQEVAVFCFRIALSTMIFKKDIPFLLLDDPFVNLDPNNFDMAIKMLKKLSKKTQVIYFTCNERGNKNYA